MLPNGNAEKSELYTPSVIEQKQYWDERWDRSRRPNLWQLRRGESIITLLRSLPLVHPKILDLGCGTGWFTERLSHMGEATGLDLSEAAIRFASSQFPHIKFISGNLYETPLPGEHFDVVVSQEVIAHVENQETFLGCIAHTLKPNGYLVVTTVNKFVIERTHQPPDPPEHIKQWLTRRVLKHLLQPYFHVLHMTTVIPMGNRGILRVINSHKVNTALHLLISHQRLDTLKERAGFGYTRIVLAKKRS